jgi:hypothetical protein
MLQKGTFCHSRQADTANQPGGQPNDLIKQMKARVDWRQKESEPLGDGAARDPKRSLQQKSDNKCTS